MTMTWAAQRHTIYKIQYNIYNHKQSECEAKDAQQIQNREEHVNESTQ